MNRLSSIVVATLLTICVTSDAFAGLVKVSCDPGSRVSLFVRRMNGPSDPQQAQTDTNNDGIVEFAVANQNTVKNLFICKATDGRRIWYQVNIVVGGATLVSLEPFKLPTFAAVDGAQTLFTRVDAEDFLGEGNPFTVGQLTTAVGGSISETSTVTFRDGTGLPDEPDFSVLDPDTLPDFSGDIEVMPLDCFTKAGASIVPTVSEWGLIFMGLLAFTAGTVMYGRWRRVGPTG